MDRQRNRGGDEIMLMVPQQPHRSYDEIRRQILDFLCKYGPSSLLEIEYAIEINSGQTKRLMKDLIAAELISILSPQEADLSQIRKVQISTIVQRVFRITVKGKKCMHLMNKIASQMNTPVNVQYNLRRASGYFHA